MVQLTKEMKQYLLAQKKNIEYQLQGLPAGSFWQGYCQGKLDQIDFALRFGTGDWSREFGGTIEKSRWKVKERILRKIKRMMGVHSPSHPSEF